MRAIAAGLDGVIFTGGQDWYLTRMPLQYCDFIFVEFSYTLVYCSCVKAWRFMPSFNGGAVRFLSYCFALLFLEAFKFLALLDF